MVEKTIQKNKLLQLESNGFARELILNLKLIWLLLIDPRVHFLLKLIPVGALIYLVSPIDLIPGVVLPVIGALDDAAMLWIGSTFFLNLCPEQVVQEHQRTLGLLTNPTSQAPTDDDVVDVSAKDITDNQN